MVINLFPDLLPCSEAELSVKEKKNKRGGEKRKRISKEINSKKIFLVITTSSSKDLDEVQNFSQVILVFNISDAGLYFGTKKKVEETIPQYLAICETVGLQGLLLCRVIPTASFPLIPLTDYSKH